MKSSVASNFTAEYTVRLTGTGGSYGAVYAYSDSRNYSTAMINPSAQTIELARITNGVTTTMGSYAINGQFDAKCWHSIRLEKCGTNLKVFVDNMLCGTVTDAAATSGYVAMPPMAPPPSLVILLIAPMLMARPSRLPIFLFPVVWQLTIRSIPMLQLPT